MDDDGVSEGYDGSTSREQVEVVQQRVLSWYATFGRDLPWRHTRDPYAILVAEIMLQQTGVERVLPKYHEFLNRFPSLEVLASAPTGAVIRAWGGLGYNMRAVRLQAVARQVMAENGGVVPSTVEDLMALAGIGRYTAGAVACFAFGRDVAFLDTNVRRVLGRVFRGPEVEAAPPGERAALRLADEVLPRGHAYEWHQALMDIGATVCTVRAPACLPCPVGDACRGRYRVGREPAARRVMRESGPGWESASTAQPGAARGTRRGTSPQPFVGSTRYYRGRIIAVLREVVPGETIDLEQLGRRVKPEFAASDVGWLNDLVRRLAADGLLELCADESGDPTVWRVALPA